MVLLLIGVSNTWGSEYKMLKRHHNRSSCHPLEVIQNQWPCLCWELNDLFSSFKCQDSTCKRRSLRVILFVSPCFSFFIFYWHKELEARQLSSLAEVKEWRRALLIWLKWECGQRSEEIITAIVLCTSLHTTDKAMPGAAETMLNLSYCNQSRRHVWNVLLKWAVLF